MSDRSPAHVASSVSQVTANDVDITIMVPCFNEELNIETSLDVLLEAFRPLKWTYELLVVDDGSRDRTAEIIGAFMASHPQAPITFVRNATNMGLGFNYFAAAHLGRGRHYMLINGDNDVPPETIRTMVNSIEADSLAIFYPVDSRPWQRRALSRTFVMLVRMLSGTRLQHYNSGAVYKSEQVRGWNNRANGYGYQAEFLCHLVRDPRCRYVEIPIHIQTRHKGRSKAFTLRNLGSIASSLGRILLNRFKQPLPKGGVHEHT